MIIKLTAPDGSVVWDATVHNSGLCVQMLDHLAENMASRYPNWRGSYTETLYPVRSSFRDVASLAIGYYGPFSFSDQELSVHQFAEPAAAVGHPRRPRVSPAAWACSWRGASPCPSSASRSPRSGSRPVTGTCDHGHDEGTGARRDRPDGERPLPLARRAGGPAPTPHDGHGARAAHAARHAPEPPRGADRRGVEGGSRPARGPARRDPPHQPDGRGHGKPGPVRERRARADADEGGPRRALAHDRGESPAPVPDAGASTSPSRRISRKRGSRRTPTSSARP